MIKTTPSIQKEPKQYLKSNKGIKLFPINNIVQENNLTQKQDAIFTNEVCIAQK